MRMQFDQPQSICILRLSSLGDATHVVPVIRSLQASWPGTRITWVIGTLEHRLMRGLEGIEFIVFDKRGGWRAVRQLRSTLSGRRFDVLLHMQVAARANLLSRFIRAPVRLGWDRARSRDFHRCFTNASIAAVPFQHQVQAFLEFPRALGLKVEQPRWELPVSEEARLWARERLDPDRRNLVISPCSSHVWRNWQAAHYAAVADFASAELGMKVILSGGPGEMERDTGTAIQHLMKEPCLNLVGADTLEQSKALLGQADLLISPDSGPVHLASALGTDVLGLYAATWSRRSGPYRSLDLCVDRFPEAARRYRHSEPEQLRWGSRIERPGVMDLIEPADVIRKLRAWWERRWRPDRHNRPV
jgi:heptosyltransferase I